MDYFSGVFNWESSGITPYSVTGMYGIELELKSSELLELKDGTPYSHSGQSFTLLELSFGTWTTPYTGCALSVHPAQKNEARANVNFPQCLRMKDFINKFLLFSRFNCMDPPNGG